MAVGMWRNGDLAVSRTGQCYVTGPYYVVPQEGCSFCACDTGLFSVGMVIACRNEHGTCARGPLGNPLGIADMPILPRTPALTDVPSEFDLPHVERLRLLHAMALCMQRAPTRSRRA
jgi:hypothetical protein